jgi:hypothetical protein
MDKVRGSIPVARPAFPGFMPGRAALVAGGIGFAAGLVLLGGAVAVLGIGRPVAAPTVAPAWIAAAEDTRVLKQTVHKLEQQVSGLKASVDASNKHASSQRAQIASRYEQGAKSQGEMQTRLAKIGDAVDRLEKRVAAAAAVETTGSIAPRNVAPATTVAAATPPAAAVAEPKPPAEPAIVGGWAIRDVFRGRALVSNRRGVFEAAPGLFLPELGRVEAVTRRNGRWVVVTEKGIITTMHRPRAADGYDAD